MEKNNFKLLKSTELVESIQENSINKIDLFELNNNHTESNTDDACFLNQSAVPKTTDYYLNLFVPLQQIKSDEHKNNSKNKLFYVNELSSLKL